MSRIRSIHPGVWTDEEFVSVDPATRLFFIGIWTECDDRGVFEWSPIKLKMRLTPADTCDTFQMLGRLADAGSVQMFEVDGKKFGAVRNFMKWQRPKTPMVKYPLLQTLEKYVGMPSPADAKPERGTALGKHLCEQQNGQCHYCKEEITFYRKKLASLEVDHKVPMSRGGVDEISNLVAACKPCNSLKFTMTDTEFLARFTKAELVANCCEKRNSQVSQTAKTASREATNQREEEGGREGGEDNKPEGSLSLPAAPAKTTKPKSKKSDKGPKASFPESFEPQQFGLGTQSRLIVDGWPEGKIETELERFAANHRARGTVMSDWQSAWSTWVLNTVAFGKSNNGTGINANRPEPELNSVAQATLARRADRVSREQELF